MPTVRNLDLNASNLLSPIGVNWLSYNDDYAGGL